MNREEIIAGTISCLRRKFFNVTTFFDTNTCFDLIAKNASLTLAIKVYENIDSIRKEQGEELRKLGQVLSAHCIIIGARTKVFWLEDDTVYYRYDVPALTLKTFEKLLSNVPPSMRYFKGKHIVDIDAQKLQRKREELELSLNELAQKVGIAAETLYRFEKGASTSVETARKIEGELGKGLVKRLDVFGSAEKKLGFDETPNEKLLGKVHDLGLKMALFEHAPFRAYGEGEKGMLITTGKGKFDIPKKAAELKKTTAVIDSDPIIITKEYKRKNVEGVPIIEEAELDTIDKVKGLRKLIRERGENL